MLEARLKALERLHDNEIEPWRRLIVEIAARQRVGERRHRPVAFEEAVDVPHRLLDLVVRVVFRQFDGFRRFPLEQQVEHLGDFVDIGFLDGEHAYGLI